MSAAEHETHMRRALAYARQGWGSAHPGPMVGAIIVEDDHVVAEGFRTGDVASSAEKAALAKLGRAPQEGATLYVTLEPSVSDGTSIAAVEQVVAAGIKRVVAGATDPHPDQAGKGIDQLRAAGVDVVTGVMESECADLNLIFNHCTVHGTPLVAAKAEVTLDGRVATRSGDSQWITGELARGDVLRWRRLFPSIAVGAGTVLDNNPRLTAQLPGEEEWCPMRFVFDGLLRSVADGAMPAVYTDEHRDRTIVVTTPHGGIGYVRKLRELGVQVWILPSATQRVPMAEFRKRCAEQKISGVYFEGGSQLVSQILQDRQIDYLFLYRAPLLFADDRAKPVLHGLRTEKVGNAIRLADVRHELLGDDTLTRGRVIYPQQMFIDETTFSLG